MYKKVVKTNEGTCCEKFFHNPTNLISCFANFFLLLRNCLHRKCISSRNKKIDGMNENIKKFLDGYMKNADPQYAVMLTGHWGCGKTFFVDQWMKGLEKAGEDREEVIYLMPTMMMLRNFNLNIF